MSITCTRRIQFCCGHRVMGHENKCANLHGHNYVALFTAEADSFSPDPLDAIGRVIDFSVLKERLGGWIDDNWDHGFVLAKDDTEAIRAMRCMKSQRFTIMTSNPTAENMARLLLTLVAPQVLKDTGVRVTKVVLWETENCFAEAVLEGH